MIGLASAEAWGEDGCGICLSVGDPMARAASVTAMTVPGADDLREWLSQQCGVTLGIGLGAAQPRNALRVAHMGHANAATIMGVLGCMEAGMTALDIAHGPGALEAAARVIAEPA